MDLRILDQPFELEEKYWEKINEYIEADVDEEYGNTSEGEDESRQTKVRKML